MSMRIMFSSVSNSAAASVLASSVLPTPAGPRNRNDPIGRRGSLLPEKARVTGSSTSCTAPAAPPPPPPTPHPPPPPGAPAQPQLGGPVQAVGPLGLLGLLPHLLHLLTESL